jgi:hypothetical protein
MMIMTAMETFVSGDIEWRVLHTDEQGNQLVITEYVYAAGAVYDSSGEYKTLPQSDGLQPALDKWREENVSDYLKSKMLVVKDISSDVRGRPTDDQEMFHEADVKENSLFGLTRPYPPAENYDSKAFVLSISEVNEYVADDNIRRSLDWDGTASRGWLLRSPGFSDSPVAVVAEDGTISGVCSDTVASGSPKIGIRPALWINHQLTISNKQVLNELSALSDPEAIKECIEKITRCSHCKYTDTDRWEEEKKGYKVCLYLAPTTIPALVRLDHFCGYGTRQIEQGLYVDECASFFEGINWRKTDAIQ